ncbi:hypothetical protein [Chitiniphilus eburneus]|uniref:Uncharacterized protein n=1 Tax=Chitiniphilus eburneus TaxID=2571148 RepID=A0A4V5MPP9_9NEIS|nr:hypothetical protein [Chitiniphilus eburneus]TJZ69348.1 hypothetical protein FAZ21_14890 [Chitiniphilus eburneus]
MRPLPMKSPRSVAVPLPLARGAGHAGYAMVFAVLALLATLQSPPLAAPQHHPNLQSTAIPTQPGV